MKYIVERWVEEEDKEMEEKVLRIAEEKEAKKVAEEWKQLEDTKRVTLHYCRHEEGLPCERKVL